MSRAGELIVAFVGLFALAMIVGITVNAACVYVGWNYGALAVAPVAWELRPCSALQAVALAALVAVLRPPSMHKSTSTE